MSERELDPPRTVGHKSARNLSNLLVVAVARRMPPLRPSATRPVKLATKKTSSRKPACPGLTDDQAGL